MSLALMFVPLTTVAMARIPRERMGNATSIDPFVGSLAFIRVYSGVLAAGSSVFNSAKGRRDRIGRLLQMHANKREDITEVRTGDIGAAVGFKDVYTGETIDR